MSDKMREEFEAAYAKAGSVGGWAPDFRLHKNGDYMQPTVYWAFWSWKASRATLVVNITVHEEFDKRMYASNVYKELDKAGISYE